MVKQPESQHEVVPGSNVSFSIETRHAAVFQWCFSNNIILTNSSKYVGARSKTLTVLHVASEDAGGYYCQVSTSFHSTNSYYVELSLSKLGLV